MLLLNAKTKNCSKKRDDSPRRRLLEAKFSGEVSPDETIIQKFLCASKDNILVQGELYVTNKCCYFYSALNNKLMFGRNGTKIILPFSNIASVKKQDALWIFPSTIKFLMKNGKEYSFTSFLSRDTCYILIVH